MGLSIGIVGLPNVGKSTLFNALTNSTNALAENYPFATIDPNIGIVPIPDERLDTLSKMFDSKKTVPATVSFVDIAGLVKGASKGEGLGNKFLSNIRETDAICQVVRAFDNDNITHVDNSIDPKRDIETINTELILADLQTLESAVPRYKKELSGKKIEPEVLRTAEKAFETLNDGKLLYTSNNDFSPISELGLITTKKQLIVFNVSTDDLKNESKITELKNIVHNKKNVVFINAELESELVGLSKDEQIELLESETGFKISGLQQLATMGFNILGLQTFFTAGEKESKAWTIHKGWTAPLAAGVIHSDFQKGFIKANVVSFDDLVTAGSLQKASEMGKLRMEGKDYIMQNDDVVEFMFNN